MQQRVARIFRLAMFAAVFAAIQAASDESAAVPPRVVAGRMRVELERLVDRPPGTTLSNPTITMAFAPGDTDRMFFVEKGGPPGTTARLRVLDNGTYSTFLNLSTEVASDNENGFLGMAFHPGYANPLSAGYRKLYTYHSVPTDAGATVDFPSPVASDFGHHNVITEWQVSAGNPNLVDVSTRREVLREAHPDTEHNAGTITFGPDGYLYGAFGTPFGPEFNLFGQDNSNLLGTVYRIDPLAPSATPASTNPVSANGKYRIPADNPFVSDPAALDEIYAYGFRNPYRFSVDSETGLLFVGDVGQGTNEEVDVVIAGGNYGWPYRQGTDSGVVPLPTPAPTLVSPIAQYSHSDGKAIVGGYVYRGSIPALQGKYIYGDFSTNFFNGRGKLFFTEPFDEEGNLKELAENRVLQIITAPATCAQSLSASAACAFDSTLLSFGEDSDGELYTLSISSGGAVVYKITDAYFLPEGDYNEDGTVDASDYTLWRDTLGQSVAFGRMADGDGDGVIDTDDYNVWKAHFGESISLGSGGVASVPEPATASIALIAALTAAFAAGRQRRHLCK